jgi:hypothetical protein
LRPVIGSAEKVDAALHRRIEDVIASAGLSDAASLADVLTAVARHRGRTIELEPLPTEADPGHVFGLCLAYPDRDVILFRTGAGAEHELHSTLHECGHLLMGHVAAETHLPVDSSQLARLLPDLDPELIAGALARSSYECQQEREAETFAMQVRQIIAAQQRRRGDAILRRFDDALG